MLAYKYTYLLGSLLFFVYWFYLFFKLKDYRRRLFLMSLIYAVLLLPFGYFYTADWWKPDTILGYRLGIEDFLLAFSNNGIAAVWFLLFFKINNKGNYSIFRISMPLVIVGLMTIVLILIFNWTSFYATCVGIFVAIFYILYQRRDLIKISLLSGMVMILISLPIYLLMIFMSPGYVEHTWILNKLSGFLFLGIPIEDVIWYFLAGAMVSILYPFYNEEKYDKKN